MPKHVMKALCNNTLTPEHFQVGYGADKTSSSDWGVNKPYDNTRARTKQRQQISQIGQPISRGADVSTRDSKEIEPDLSIQDEKNERRRRRRRRRERRSFASHYPQRLDRKREDFTNYGNKKISRKLSVGLL